MSNGGFDNQTETLEMRFKWQKEAKWLPWGQLIVFAIIWLGLKVPFLIENREKGEITVMTYSNDRNNKIRLENDINIAQPKQGITIKWHKNSF